MPGRPPSWTLEAQAIYPVRHPLTTQRFEPEAFDPIEGYTLANARLTWANADSDLEISAEVTNLFDEYYLLTVFDLTTAGAGISTG